MTGSDGWAALEPDQERIARTGRFVRVDLSAPVDFGGGERARTAFVAHLNGRWIAWANVCRHRAVDLDFNAPGPRTRPRLAPLAEDGFHLVCFSHGALYRPDDGTCISGPCPDAKLHSLHVEERDGKVLVAPGPRVG